MTDIGGEWSLNNMRNTKPPRNKARSSKKQQEEDNKIKGKLKITYDYWKYWKFQINWKKLECVVQLIQDAKKNPFFMSSNKLF